MDNSVFYQQNAKQIPNRFLEVSSRFQTKEGKRIPWEIRCLNQKENEELIGRNRKAMKLEEAAYEAELLAAAVVTPDLKNAQLQDSYRVAGSSALLRKMLTVGEYEILKKAVEEICMA